MVKEGRYGPYLQHKRVMATVPRGTDPMTLALDQAVTILAAKAAKPSARGGRGKARAAKKAEGDTATPAKAPRKSAKAGAKKSAAKAGGAAGTKRGSRRRAAAAPDTGTDSPEPDA